MALSVAGLRNEYEYVVKGHSIDAVIAALYLYTQGKSVAYLESGSLYPPVIRDRNARILDFGFRFIPKLSNRSSIYSALRSLDPIRFDHLIGNSVENFKSIDLLCGDIRQTLMFDSVAGFRFRSPSNFIENNCQTIKEVLTKINGFLLKDKSELLTKEQIRPLMGPFHETFEKVLGIPQEAFRTVTNLKEFYSTSFSKQASIESVFQLSVLQALCLGIGAQYKDPSSMGFVEFAHLLIQLSYSGRTKISSDLFYDRIIQYASSFIPCLTSGFSDYVENGISKGILEFSNGRLIPSIQTITFNSDTEKKFDVKGVSVLVPKIALGYLPSMDGVILRGPYDKPIRYSIESIHQAGLTLGSIKQFSAYAKHPESYAVITACGSSIQNENELLETLTSEFYFLGRERLDLLYSNFSELRSEHLIDLGHLAKSAELFFKFEGNKS